MTMATGVQEGGENSAESDVEIVDEENEIETF